MNIIQTIESGIGNISDKRGEFNRLIKGVLSDEQYNDFLNYVGKLDIEDLDKDVGLLIYVLSKVSFIKTYRSCSGHIGRYHIDAGKSTRDTHYVYCPGLLFFKVSENNESSKSFIVKLKMLIEKNKHFVELTERDNDYEIVLEMKDIREKVGDIGYNVFHSEVHEVEIEKCKYRYDEFMSFWKQLTNIAFTHMDLK